MKRLLSWSFALTLLCSFVYQSAYAIEDSWDDATKTLTVNSNPVANAYKWNVEIEHLVFGLAVTAIGDSAFAYCDHIQTVALPDYLETIGKGAFANCSDIGTIEITDDVTSIGAHAFDGCSALQTVTVYPYSCALGEGGFDNCSALKYIFVPSGRDGYYKAAANWSAYASKIMVIPTHLQVGQTYNAGTNFDFGEETYFTIGESQANGSVWKTGSIGTFSFVEGNTADSYKMTFTTSVSYYLNGVKKSNTDIAFEVSAEPASFTVLQGAGTLCNPYFFTINTATHNTPMPHIATTDTILNNDDSWDFGCDTYFSYGSQIHSVSGVDSLLIEKGAENFVLRAPNHNVTWQLTDYDPMYLYITGGDGTEQNPYALAAGDVATGVARETFTIPARTDDGCGNQTFTGEDISIKGTTCADLPAGMVVTTSTSYTGISTEIRLDNLLEDTIAGLICIVEGTGSIKAQALKREGTALPDYVNIGSQTRVGNVITFTDLNEPVLYLKPDEGEVLVKKISVLFRKTPHKTRLVFNPCADSFEVGNILITNNAACSMDYMTFNADGQTITIEATDSATLLSIKMHCKETVDVSAEHFVVPDGVSKVLSNKVLLLENINATSLTITFRPVSSYRSARFDYALVTTTEPDWTRTQALTQHMDPTISLLASEAGTTALDEKPQNLFDGQTWTKWCSKKSNAYKYGILVFRTAASFIMDNYTLVTSGITSLVPNNRWLSWDVYGGTFGSDQAAHDAIEQNEGWTLLHSIEKDSLLLPENNAASLYTFENSTPYKYYRLKVNRIVEDTMDVSTHFQNQEMAEMRFSDRDLPITVKGFKGEYDGAAHGITVEPARTVENFSVAYSEDGENYVSTPLTYTAEGQYIVYFRITTPGFDTLEGMSGVRITHKDTPTTIDPVTGNPSPVTLKVIKNGQLYIIRDGKTYNVQGAVVK